MSPSPDAPPTFRAMSFNLWADRSEARPESQSWRNRRGLIVSLLRFHRPDAIGFQEAVRARVLQLAEALPEYGWIGGGRSDGAARGEMNPIFYRREMFQPLRSGTFWLSPTPERPSKGWDASYPRIATWAELKWRGNPFLFCNTHFDHGGLRARRESAALLLRKVDELAGKAARVVLGDFNCRPGGAAYRILAAALRDARACSAETPLGPSATWRGMFRGVMPPARLDYIFVGGGIGVRRHAVLADHWDGRVPSDHLPVVADLFFEPAASGAKLAA